MATVKQCDRCHLTDKEDIGPFHTVTVKVDGAEAADLDFCNRCTENLRSATKPLQKTASVRPRSTESTEVGATATASAGRAPVTAKDIV